MKAEKVIRDEHGPRHETCLPQCVLRSISEGRSQGMGHAFDVAQRTRAMAARQWTDADSSREGAGHHAGSGGRSPILLHPS
jgi:hypothetical protein